MKVTDMSPLGIAVADLLGDVFKGIYHLDYKALSRVRWNDNYCIIFILSWWDLSTFDFDELTKLVVLSHDRMIRISINAVAPHRMQLLFHQRKTRIGSISERMPTMEEHIEIIRKDLNEVPLEEVTK